jgi:uncharacterized protein YdaU (DUF1376 family)
MGSQMSRKTDYKRPRLPPMPIEPLIDNPRFLALPVAGRGILITLCLHFWQTECAAMPIDKDQLFTIARAHKPTWQTYRIEIMKIFELWSTIAKRDWQARINRRANLLALGDKARSFAALNHLRKHNAPAYATAAPDLNIVISPKRSTTSPPPIRHAGPHTKPAQTTSDPTKPKRFTDR